MLVIGVFNWQIQERILPGANQKQDALRLQIRNNGIINARTGKYWVANENRIYSFDLPEDAQPVSQQRKVKDLTIYEFSEAGTKLHAFIKTDLALWTNGKIRFLGDVEKIVWKDDVPQPGNSNVEIEIAENYNPFKQVSVKPSHLNSQEIAEQIKTVESESEKRLFAVSLQKKYTTLFLPLIITLFTAPFALSLNRKGKVVTSRLMRSGFGFCLWASTAVLNNSD